MEADGRRLAFLLADAKFPCPPPGRPTQILLADYYLPRMHVACPPCLYNGLRQDAIKAQPDLQERIRAWAA